MARRRSITDQQISLIAQWYQQKRTVGSNKEAARRIGVSPWKLRYWINRIKLGKA